MKRIDGKRLREWQHMGMAGHVWAPNPTFECCTGVFVCSHDAARLGKPAEETEVLEVTSHGMNFTTILPSQARTCNTLPLHAIPCRENAITCYCLQYLVIAFKTFVFWVFLKKVCDAIIAIIARCVFFEFAIIVCCISVVEVRAAAAALQCNAGASRVGTEHTAGWLTIEASVPEVEAESVQVPREQGRQDAEDEPQSQGPR